MQTFGLIYLRNYVLRDSENTRDSILGSAHIIPLNTMILSRHSRRDRKESANHWFETYQCISIAGSLAPFTFLEIWVQLFVTEFCLCKLNTTQLPVTQLQLLCQVQWSHTLLLPSLLQGSQQVGKLHPLPLTLTLGLVHSKREREKEISKFCWVSRDWKRGMRVQDLCHCLPSLNIPVLPAPHFLLCFSY